MLVIIPIHVTEPAVTVDSPIGCHSSNREKCLIIDHAEARDATVFHPTNNQQ
jgi:hypothetical protein